MKALKTLTHHHHHHHPSSAPSTHPPPPTRLNRALIANHFRDNQPPLRAANFSSFANDASALAHGVAHPPEATYFALILSPPFYLVRVRKIIETQIPELEAFEEEGATISGDATSGNNRRNGAAKAEEEVKVVRIRGSVRGWWSVLQGVLDDEEGGAYFLQRVLVVWHGREVEAYRATLHFPGG